MVDRLRSYQEAMFWDYDLIDWCDRGQNKTNRHQMTDIRLDDVNNEVNFWQESPYEYQMGINHTGMVNLCAKKYNDTQIEWFEFFTEYHFTYRLYLDDLPSATVLARNVKDHKEKINYHEGVPIGVWDEKTGKGFIVNHLEITVLLQNVAGSGKQEGTTPSYRVIGFDIEPYSLAEGANRFKPPHQFNHAKQPITADTEIHFSYNIKSKHNPDLDWAHRMDHYQKLNSHYFKVQHTQLWITFAILVVLTIITFQIMVWTLSWDYLAIAKIEKAQNDFLGKRAQKKRSDLDQSYGQLNQFEHDDPEDKDAEVRKPDPELEKDRSVLWRKLGGEVMRAPGRSNMFAVFVGTGVQVYVIFLLMLLYQGLNMFTHLSFRPLIWYSIVVSMACTGAFNGFFMAKTMKLFGQATNWKEMSCVSACFFPMIMTLIVFMIDLLEYVEQAEEEIDVSTGFTAICLWVVICVPATFLGASRAMLESSDRDVIAKPHSIPRTIP